MKHHWFGLIELGVALTFVAGWGVLELIVRRLDKRRAAAVPGGASEGDARHPEGQ